MGKYMAREPYKAAKEGKVEFLSEKGGGGGDGYFLSETPMGNNILHIATEMRQESFVKKAVELCPKLLSRPNSEGDTPLHVAARSGSLKVVQLLVESYKNRASASATDMEQGVTAEQPPSPAPWTVTNAVGYTALHEALRFGHQELAKYLLEQDPSLASVVTNARESPLYLAAEKWHTVDFMNDILSSDVPYSTEGPWNQNPLHALALNICDESCAEQLLRKKPDLITQEDVYGRTALHYAAKSAPKFTKWLLEKNAYLAYKGDKNGLTPLHLAARTSSIENIRAILDFCPDSMELLDGEGRHPLHLAAASGNLDSVRELLKFPEIIKFINRTDKSESTPFHLAIQNKHYPVIKELLENKWVDAWAESNGISFLNLYESDPMFQIYADKNFLLFKSFLHQKAPQQRQNPIVGENLCGEETTESQKSKSEEILMGYLKQRANSLSVVAALLTTIAFAAAFTIPGGFNNNPPHVGHVVLGKQAMLHIFLVADTLAVCFAIVVVFLLIWEQEDDIMVLDRRIRCSVILLLAALCGTLVAFMSGLYAVISTEALWLAILICTIGSDPFIEDLSSYGWRSPDRRAVKASLI
ncbi:uncharacterized protein LOC131145174 isoform X2 [Malania oleifera]|uniref:uncharacterized protein LOC131145174 isoform X2 n=1 Tax=Malania oleifera TaxID=397392 RepID=UPI0025AE97A0|nr:uncharacterized protein LOC131145174 isoform X2 [Malania oleifera]